MQTIPLTPFGRMGNIRTGNDLPLFLDLTYVRSRWSTIVRPFCKAQLEGMYSRYGRSTGYSRPSRHEKAGSEISEFAPVHEHTNCGGEGDE